jgi:hypothetical protein
MIRSFRALRTAVLALGLGLAGGAGGTAHAGPGDGISLGTSTTLSPDIDVGLLYRSNIVQSSDDPVGGVSLTVAPGARLDYQTPDSEFRFTGDYRLVKFFSRRLSAADQFNDFDLQADGSFLRTRPVGISFYQRAALANNNTDRLGNTPFHTRFRNQSQLGLQIRPGPVLQFDVRGNFEYDNFRVPLGAQLAETRGFNERFGVGGVVHAEWRFFPRTAVVLDVDVTRYSWARNWIAEGPGGTFLAMPGSTHTRIMPGIRGRFTEKLVVVGQVGYGLAQYREQDVLDACGGAGAECDPENPANPFGRDLRGLQRLLLVAQLQYAFDEGRRFTLGYRKDFDDVFFSNFMAYHRIYGALNSRLGSGFSTEVTASIRQEAYRGEVNRNDTFLRFSGDLTYELQTWARLTGGMAYIQRISPSAARVNFNDVQARVLFTFVY